MILRPASPEFKRTIEDICPNECDLNIPDWLRLAARSIGIEYPRLNRLWRDNRAKIRQREEEKILQYHRAKSSVQKAIITLGETDELYQRLQELHIRLDRAEAHLERN